MIFSNNKSGSPQWLGILNPSDGSLVSNFKLQDTSNSNRIAILSEDSIILTPTQLLIGMADIYTRFRVCRFTHNPSLTYIWCWYNTNSNNARVYAITLDPTQTFVFAGGYFDPASNNKIALVMKIKFSDGSDGICRGWF